MYRWNAIEAAVGVANANTLTALASRLNNNIKHLNFTNKNLWLFLSLNVAN